MAHGYTEAIWRDHPGRNPDHVFGGYSRWVEIPDPSQQTGFGSVTMTRVLRYARNPSRWIPHQRSREISRRRGRMST